MGKRKHVDSEFGSLVREKNGYWHVSEHSHKNHGKLWHRLIWERFHGKKIPEGYVVHHIDENPSNNCIMNLCIMTYGDHNRLHKVGKSLSDETKKKIGDGNRNNQKLINSLTGRTIPDDVRDKIRNTMIGKRIQSKNLTEYKEIRKNGGLYCYFGEGLTSNRLKRSKYYNKVVEWAKTNNMPLTLMEA